MLSSSASDYAKVIILDIPEEERRKYRRKSKDKNGIENVEKWSKHWKNIDWNVVQEKLTEAEKKVEKYGGTKEEYDIGITEEQFIEYLRWLNENNPKEFEKAMLCLDLRQSGMEEQQIELLLSHPEKVKQAKEKQFLSGRRQSGILLSLGKGTLCWCRSCLEWIREPHHMKMRYVLGHADIGTTMNIYTDATSQLKAREFSVLSEYLEKNVQEREEKPECMVVPVTTVK